MTHKRTSRMYSGNNKRGQIKIPQHTHPLVRQLFECMNDQRATFLEVSQKAGVGVDTLRFWPNRHMPLLDKFERALHAMDLELCIRRRVSIAPREPRG